MGIVPLILLYGVKEISSSFSIPFKNQNSVIKAYYFFKIYEKMVWVVAFILIIIINIAMIKHLEDKAGLGPNLVFSLTTLLYGAIINGVIIMPFKLLIEKQIKTDKAAFAP